jgi:hypothetical protein
MRRWSTTICGPAAVSALYPNQGTNKFPNVPAIIIDGEVVEADAPSRLVQTWRLGRTPKLAPHRQREPIPRRDNGETVLDIGSSYNVSHSTISRLTD